jgi:peptidoglycan/xylan/chitin deacetylase (PgdA/CDA1 family)
MVPKAKRRGPPTDARLRRAGSAVESAAMPLDRPVEAAATSPAPVRVSVIVPARNAGATLARTLASLLAQTDPSWQALIIDDGSTDDTARIAAEHAARDARLRVIPGPARGVSAARNCGLAQATASRVVFLDADDTLAATLLEQLGAALDAAPQADAAYCDNCRVMPDGAMAPAHCEPTLADDPLAVFARYCGVAIHAVMVRREALQRAGGFDETLRTCEDWDLWQRIAAQTGRWVHVPGTLALYHQRTESLSNDLNQMLGDAVTVIRRAHLALAAAGHADAGAGDAAIARWALWVCAIEAARGALLDPQPPERLALLQALNADDRDLHLTLLDGLMVGQQAVPAMLAARWPSYGVALTRLIDVLGAQWRDAPAARALQYAVERRLLDLDGLDAPRTLGLTQGRTLELRTAAALEPPPGVDRLRVRVCIDGQDVRTVDRGAMGTVEVGEWVAHAAEVLGLRPPAKAARNALLRALGPRRAAAAARAAWRVLSTPAVRTSGARAAARQAGRAMLQRVAAPSRAAGSHGAVLEELRRRATSLVQTAAPSPPGAAKAPTAFADDGTLDPGGADRQRYWEQFFQTADPWNYGSPYEQEKYALQLSLLPAAPIDRALELACAEGHFTWALAPRVQRLVATDISATALRRAEQRCSAHRNVEYRALDLVADELPQGLDLVVCSEVLYFLPDEAALRRAGQRIAQALRPGGHLLTAHAFVVEDDRAHTGFDWNHPWGARTISRVLSSLPGLVLEQSICTPLYRIDRFVRREADAPHTLGAVREVAMQAPLEHEVAKHVVWGGAVTRRIEVAGRERRDHVPVLAYHRIADDGPPALARYRVGTRAFDAQVNWLRRHGYHTIVADELAWFLQERHPFIGRPVVITFDDGYQDFADAAWPVLRRHDMRADVFVVTDLVGRSAEWDHRFGATAPLMDAQTIAGLAAQGVRFGSHLATHRRADGLSTRELADELLRSRAALDRWTGHEPCAVAAPFGMSDERVQRLAVECGYRIGLGTHPGAASLWHEAMHLPRIEVAGGMTLETFAAALEAVR